MVTRPGIPLTEFTPAPQAIPALWGFALRTVDGRAITDELLDLGDAEVGGRPVPWLTEPDSGVRFARVCSPWGLPLAVARAVPLS